MSQGRATPTASTERKVDRISALGTAHINSWSSGVPTSAGASGYIYNGIAEQYANDPSKSYVTHRPHINVYEPDSTMDNKGRGIYFWTAASSLYIFNNDTIYKGSYATACTMYNPGTPDTAIASGTGKVYWQEWAGGNENYLFIIDPENDGIYCIAASASTTVINIADRSGAGTGAPFHASDDWDFDALNAWLTSPGLAHGAVNLDGYLFLGLEDGQVINSGDSTDPTSWLLWDALNTVAVDRSVDKLRYIGKQQDEIVAIGSQSIEFLYDNSNASGSPLNIRTDVAYRTGTPFAGTCWEWGDSIFFFGVDPGGDFALYELTNHQLSTHTNNTLQSMLWMSRYVDDLEMVAHGFSVGGHVYYCLTTTDAGTGIITVVYDATTDVWAEWESTVNSGTQFQLIGYMIRANDNVNRPQGIMRNGDVFLIGDSKTPYDIVDGGSNVNIPLKITTGPFDGGTTESKFMHSLSYVGNVTQATYNVTVEWSDDDGANWDSQTLDVNLRTQINRMGKFTSRRFRFTLTGTVYVRFEGVDVTYTQGSN